LSNLENLNISLRDQNLVKAYIKLFS